MFNFTNIEKYFSKLISPASGAIFSLTLIISIILGFILTHNNEFKKLKSENTWYEDSEDLSDEDYKNFEGQIERNLENFSLDLKRKTTY